MRSALALVLTLLGLAYGHAGAQTPPSTVNPALPTIFVVGDSTANNNADGGTGWGDPFKSYFDPSKVNVVNRARAGRSSRTFYSEGLWAKVLDEVKAGDVVVIQFGHNDGGPVDKEKMRGSLPGLGEETKEVTKPDGTKETVHTFGWYLRKFVADTRSKGATPVIASLTVRNIWKDGKVERGSGQFGSWSSIIAQYGQTEFIDLTNAIADKYEQTGEQAVKEFFPKDHTHTNFAGADLNASLVVAGLKAIRNCAVCTAFSEKGKTVPAAPIGRRRPMRSFPEAEPKLPTLFLVGDSTVRNGSADGANGQWGWGEPLFDLFDPTKINVVNRAVGGLSTRTYLSTGYWAELLARVKKGDFVMIQFGHNDGGTKQATPFGSLAGTGDESENFYNSVLKTDEVVQTYGWYLRKYILDVRAKGAVPIICSLVPRKIWKDGRIVRNSGDFAGWARQVAEREKVMFLDLNELIAAEYEKLGEERVDPLFADARVHTSRAGAELNAQAVIAGLNMQKKNPLEKFYSQKGKRAAASLPSKR